jgi:hypothetical protein
LGSFRQIRGSRPRPVLEFNLFPGIRATIIGELGSFRSFRRFSDTRQVQAQNWVRFVRIAASCPSPTPSNWVRSAGFAAFRAGIVGQLASFRQI